MKKIMSCLLICFLVGITSNVMHASPLCSKACIEKSIVSKIESSTPAEKIIHEQFNLMLWQGYSCDNLLKVIFQPVFLKPDNYCLPKKETVHCTEYILAIPKEYLLPPKTTSWGRLQGYLSC